MSEYRFKPDELKLLRKVILDSYGLKRGRIELSERYNTDNDIPPHMNVRLVSQFKDWDDTDLWHNGIDWSEIRKPIELDGKGEGCIDFWVYSLGKYGELEGNAQVYFSKDRGMYRIEQDHPILWEKE